MFSFLVVCSDVNLRGFGLVAFFTSVKASSEETEHYTVIYSGVDRHVRGQSGVMIWLHKSISNNIDHYTFGTTELQKQD